MLLLSNLENFEWQCKYKELGDCYWKSVYIILSMSNSGRLLSSYERQIKSFFKETISQTEEILEEGCQNN